MPLTIDGVMATISMVETSVKNSLWLAHVVMKDEARLATLGAHPDPSMDLSLTAVSDGYKSAWNRDHLAKMEAFMIPTSLKKFVNSSKVAPEKDFGDAATIPDI